MATTVALIGAGGKMGTRLTNNLVKSDYSMLFCEAGEAGIARLKERGLEVTPSEDAVATADIVIFAVPDALMRQVSSQLVPHIKKGATAVMLDPAAASVNEVEMRDDLNYVVCHPCHPPLFHPQATDEARRDMFGGIAAEQDIVIALMQGTEEAYVKAEELLKKAFAPVRKAHRITVQQMALLEPAMAEVVGCTAALMMKEAAEAVVREGVPREAAYAFMLGHANIALAIAFGAIDAPFSDACKIAIKYGQERIINPDWQEVFEPENLREVISQMLHPEARK